MLVIIFQGDDTCTEEV